MPPSVPGAFFFARHKENTTAIVLSPHELICFSNQQYLSALRILNRCRVSARRIRSAQLEVKQALSAGRRIVLLHETDPTRGGAPLLEHRADAVTFVTSQENIRNGLSHLTPRELEKVFSSPAIRLFRGPLLSALTIPALVYALGGAPSPSEGKAGLVSAFRLRKPALPDPGGAHLLLISDDDGRDQCQFVQSALERLCPHKLVVRHLADIAGPAQWAQAEAILAAAAAAEAGGGAAAGQQQQLQQQLASAVRGARCAALLLTQNVWRGARVGFAIRTCQRNRVPICLLHEHDVRHGGVMDLADIVQATPADIRDYRSPSGSHRGLFTGPPPMAFERTWPRRGEMVERLLLHWVGAAPSVGSRLHPRVASLCDGFDAEIAEAPFQQLKELLLEASEGIHHASAGPPTPKNSLSKSRESVDRDSKETRTSADRDEQEPVKRPSEGQGRASGTGSAAAASPPAGPRVVAVIGPPGAPFLLPLSAFLSQLRPPPHSHLILAPLIPTHTGVGKSALAAAAIRDETVRTRFDNEVFYLHAGTKEGPQLMEELFRLMDDVTLGEDYVRPETAETPQRVADALAGVLRGRPCLVVADDCTSAAQLRTLLALVPDGTAARLLVTARSAAQLRAARARRQMPERAVLSMRVGPLPEDDAVDAIIRFCCRKGAFPSPGGGESSSPSGGASYHRPASLLAPAGAGGEASPKYSGGAFSPQVGLLSPDASSAAEAKSRSSLSGRHAAGTQQQPRLLAESLEEGSPGLRRVAALCAGGLLPLRIAAALLDADLQARCVRHHHQQPLPSIMDIPVCSLWQSLHPAEPAVLFWFLPFAKNTRRTSK